MSNSDQSDYLWDGSGAPDAEFDRLEALLAPLAPRPPRIPRRRRGFLVSGVFAVLAFLLVFSALPPRAVPSRIAGLFHDNFPGEIGVRGGTRVEYAVTGDNVTLELTKRVAADLKARGANVVFVRAGSVIIDLVGVDPESVRPWSRGFAAFGSLGLTRVKSDTPLMREIHKDAQRTRDAADLGVTVELDQWSDMSGRRFVDYFLRGPSTEALTQYIKLVQSRRADLTLPADSAFLFERVEASYLNKTPHYRSYVVAKVAAVTHRHIEHARVVFNPTTNQPEVLVTLTDAGRTVFADLTRNTVGHKLAITLDGKVVSAPVVQSAIEGGRVSITLGASSTNPLHEAQGLAAALSNGTLSAPVSLTSVERVGPSMSDASLMAARALFALPFAMLVLLLGMLVSRFTPRIDPEVFPLRSGEQKTSRLARRILVSLGAATGAILAVRIPLPGINTQELVGMGASSDSYSVFAFGLMPVLSAFLLVELGAMLHPRWRRLRVSGYAGRARLGQITVVVSLLLASAQAYFFSRWLNGLDQMFGGASIIADNAVWPMGTIMLSLVAGTMLLVVLASLITRYGIGNGYVVVILAGMAREGWQLAGVIGGGLSAPALGWLAVFVAVVVALTSTVLRLTVRSRSSSLSFRLPTCGFVPLAWTSAVMMAAPLAALAGLQLPLLTSLLSANGTFEPGVFVAVSAVLAVVLSVAFSMPARWRSQVRLVSPKPTSPLGEPAFWRATLVSAGVLSVVAALYLWGSRSMTPYAPSIMWLAVVTAALMDLVADARARYRNPNLVAVWPLHRVQMTNVAVDALTGQGIDAHAQGLYFRSLFFFFAPFAPIRIMVPQDRAEEAHEALTALLGQPTAALSA